jgi:hypothetical protein
MAYVSEYGNYGAEEVILFDTSDLTADQWETLSNLTDSEKLWFVKAVLNNEDLSEWSE